MPLPKDKGNIKIKGPGEGGVSFEIKWKERKSVPVPPLPDVEAHVHAFHDKETVLKALEGAGVGFPPSVDSEVKGRKEK